MWDSSIKKGNEVKTREMLVGRAINVNQQNK